MEYIENDLEIRFDSLKPWISQFTIHGKQYGGTVSFENDIRIKYFFDCFPDVHSILELGSLEGGHTFQLAKRNETFILGIEGRDYNIRKANFVKDLLGIHNVRFICADLEHTSLSDFGRFDAVFCSGLLYHLPKPWNLIHEISEITSKVFIWTHYAMENKANVTIDGYRGHWFEESGFQDPLSGLSKKSFWVMRSSLREMLKKYQFVHLKIYDDTPNHVHGPALSLGAWK